MEYVLWGMPPYLAVRIKVTGGLYRQCLRELKERQSQGWTELMIVPAEGRDCDHAEGRQ